MGSAVGSLAQTPPGKLMLEGLSSQGGLFYFVISIFSFLKLIYIYIYIIVLMENIGLYDETAKI